MWKSKEFEDIWWCKNQINIRCQSGFGWEYNHCDRYVTVKAEKIQFLKRRIFQKKKISNFWTKDLREIVRNGLLYFLMFWFYDKDNAVSTVEQISDQEFWFWLKRKNCMNFHFSVGSIRVYVQIYIFWNSLSFILWSWTW